MTQLFADISVPIIPLGSGTIEIGPYVKGALLDSHIPQIAGGMLLSYRIGNYELLGERSADVEALAASAPDSGGVFLVPAFTGLGSPHWDAYARGTMVGLSRATTRAHVARAALEAIAFQSAELLGAMQADAGQPLIELRVDGGATANDLLMQFQADLLGVPVVRPKVHETTALGAAYLAGLAVGFWKSADDVKANWQVDRTFAPAMSRHQAGSLREQWNRAVQRAQGWAQG